MSVIARWCHRHRLVPLPARLAAISKAPGVASVAGPYSGPRGAAQINADQTIAYATVTFGQQAHDLPKAETQHVIDLAQAARGDHLRVELGGQAISEAEQNIGGS